MWYLLQSAIIIAVALTDLQWDWAGHHNNMLIGLVGGALAWLVTQAINLLIG